MATSKRIIETVGLTKVFGSTNPINVVKATFACLGRLRTIEQVEATRGVQLREPRKVETLAPAGAAPAAPAGEVK